MYFAKILRAVFVTFDWPKATSTPRNKKVVFVWKMPTSAKKQKLRL